MKWKDFTGGGKVVLGKKEEGYEKRPCEGVQRGLRARLRRQCEPYLRVILRPE
jgi:hypothetical protein